MEPSSEPAVPGPPYVLQGSCCCGLVSYASSTLPIAITHCHCLPCRKLSGAPFLSFGLYHNSALTWNNPTFKGEAAIKLSLSEIAVRGSCRNCGSPLFMKYPCRPDATSVNMGSIDDDSLTMKMVKAKEHIFLQEKASWWELSEDGLARHQAFNEPFQLRLKEWQARGKPARDDIGENVIVSVDLNQRPLPNGVKGEHKR